MTSDDAIPFKNVYYMLCYAWDILPRSYDCKGGNEDFNDIHNFFCQIFTRRLSKLLKNGLYSGYAVETDSLKTIKGKIDLKETSKKQSLKRQRIECIFDEIKIDVLLNRILNFTIKSLLKDKRIDSVNKKELRKLSFFFKDVGISAPDINNIRKLTFERNNNHYRILINICLLLYQIKIYNQEDDSIKMIKFEEETLNIIFEKFLFNYYKKYLNEEFGTRFIIDNKQIMWNLKSDDGGALNHLPVMNPDIVINDEEQKCKLIIDAKYYKNTLSTRRFNENNKPSNKIHSQNLYQIYSYISNKIYQVQSEETIDGMLIYPRVDRDLSFDYFGVGFKIKIRTIDLTKDWNEIESSLKKIVDDHFSVNLT